MYIIFLSDKAKKQLRKLPDRTRAIILKKIYSIGDDPFRHVKKLEGSSLWRLRIMDYRAIIDIFISGRKIIVLTIDKRERVYD